MWIYKNVLQLCTFRNQIKYELKISNTHVSLLLQTPDNRLYKTD